MTESQIFLPNGKPASLVRMWISYLGVLALLSLFTVLRARGRHEFILIESLMVLAIACLILLNKEAISVNISILNKTLAYTYMNSWGVEKQTIVDLTHASGEYKIDIDRVGNAWKLVLYNDSFFKNRVSIKASKKNGYTKEQLDEIVALVHQCKNRVV